MSLQEMFDGPVGVALSDGDRAVGPLWPEEAFHVANAVASRKTEFTVGRDCARRALAAVGCSPVAIPCAPDRTPIWPAGYVGSITHCDGFCAAVAARQETFAGLGIDAEPLTPLEANLVSTICRPEELMSFAEAPSVACGWPKLAFCAKEAFYKCWYPISRQFLDFHDVALAVSMETPDRGAFTVRVLAGPARNAALPVFAGRWRLSATHVHTAMGVKGV